MSEREASRGSDLAKQLGCLTEPSKTYIGRQKSTVSLGGGKSSLYFVQSMFEILYNT